MIPIPLIIFLGTLTIYLALQRYFAHQRSLDDALIPTLERIAEHLDQGNSLETALTTLATDPTNKAAPHFKRVLDHVQRDATLPEALEHAARTASTPTLAYICTLLATAEHSKANSSDALKHISRKLWDIHHLQTTITTKSSTPILILQVLGIFLLPAIYFFLATILQTDTLDTITLVNTPILIGYLSLTGILITFLDWFIFRDALQSWTLLPVTLSYHYLFLTTLAPLLTTLGGLS
jgi:Flp pilus assembly protein TadB